MFRSATLPPEPLPPDWLPSKSAVLTKVPPVVRPRIDDQIINGPRRTYRQMYAFFEMSSYDVGFTSFYHYARKIRTAAALSELNHPSLDTSRPAHELLPDIMAKNVLEAMVDPNTSTKRLNNLSLIYSRVQNAFNSRRMTEVNIEKAKAQTEAARRGQVASGPRKSQAYGPDAPFGRKADGTPYTEEEYEKGWRQAVRAVYGLDLPANYGRERESKQPNAAPGGNPNNPFRRKQDEAAPDQSPERELENRTAERRVHPSPDKECASDSTSTVDSESSAASTRLSTPAPSQNKNSSAQGPTKPPTAQPIIKDPFDRKPKPRVHPFDTLKAGDSGWV